MPSRIFTNINRRGERQLLHDYRKKVSWEYIERRTRIQLSTGPGKDVVCRNHMTAYRSHLRVRLSRTRRSAAGR